MPPSERRQSQYFFQKNDGFRVREIKPEKYALCCPWGCQQLVLDFRIRMFIDKVLHFLPHSAKLCSLVVNIATLFDEVSTM